MTRRSLVALLAWAAATFALVAALAGWALPGTGDAPPVLLLLDRSASMPAGDADAAAAGMLASLKAAGAAAEVLPFADRPGDGLAPAATDIAAALDAALVRHVHRPWSRVVLVSDGHATAGDTLAALRSARDAGMPVQWHAVARPPAAWRITTLRAPQQAGAGQPLHIEVGIAGAGGVPPDISVRARGLAGEVLAERRVAAEGALTGLDLSGLPAGLARLELQLDAPGGGPPLALRRDAALIEITPRARLLLAQGSPGPLADSLRRGGWPVEVVPASRLDDTRLAGYRALVLDDVAIGDAPPSFWRALVAAVQDQGLGLAVLGGERSFAAGSYRGSTLESILPLLSQPPATTQALRLVFLVDKSGSMGEGRTGSARFVQARRAVLATLSTLEAQDEVALWTFDAEPRLLLPPTPAPAATRALDRDWPVGPGGGTRLAPALQAAIDTLTGMPSGRRLLVVATDGVVDEAPLAGLAAQLAREKIHIIWLTIGDAGDLARLQSLVGADTGSVRRVHEAGDLTPVMRDAVARRRARVERGPVEVRQVLPLPFAPGRVDAWPAVAAHAVTRAQSDAVVPLQSVRGDPLLAYRQAGRGRVAALPAGLGAWAPAWGAWPRWPTLAGGLASWLLDTPGPGELALTVSEIHGRLQIDVAAEHPDPRLALQRPAGAWTDLPLQPIAPGLWRSVLDTPEPGVYAAEARAGPARRRVHHLHRARAEDDAGDSPPELAAALAEGLLTAWDPAPLAPAARTTRASAAWALPALLLAGVAMLVERWRPLPLGKRAGMLRRWSSIRRRILALAERQA
jgi:hypothetical protein